MNATDRIISNRLVRDSKALAARQPGGGFKGAAVPVTAQWVCPACRQPNLARRESCEFCGERKSA